MYSHRSTQKHKRKRFVSHYWDCRLKGRPPGTKKSTDPDKKKRKRVARERDLCDVKIKITEYFDAAEFTDQTGQPPPPENHTNATISLETTPFFAHPTQVSPQHTVNPWGMQALSGPPAMHMSQTQQPQAQQMEKPRKFYTIQRVNGNGGNGKADGAAGPHRHTLEESDRVKKNSVIRWMVKNEKGKRKEQVSIIYLLTSFSTSTSFVRSTCDVLWSKLWASGKAACGYTLQIRHSEDPLDGVHSSHVCLSLLFQVNSLNHHSHSCILLVKHFVYSQTFQLPRPLFKTP